jgi:multidrug efflux pump subunit AcrA (membrane-fusion protein)
MKSILELILKKKKPTLTIGIGDMRLFTTIAVIGICISLIGCKKDKEDDAAEKSTTIVQITKPVYANISEYIELNASTVYLHKEVVRSTVTGFIISLNKKLGDHVAAGEEVARLQTKEADASKNIPIEIQGTQYHGIVILKARTEGTCGEMMHAQGDYVSDGDAVLSVSDPKSMRILAHVPFTSTSLIKINAACPIHLPDGKTIDGIVEKSLPVVDAAGQTQTYLIKPAGSTSLPESLNVVIRLPKKSSINSIAVPKSALLTDEQQKEFWVMKVVNDSVAVKVPVECGAQNDSLIALLHCSLTTTDRIVTKGGFGLPDTARITVEQ